MTGPTRDPIPDPTRHPTRRPTRDPAGHPPDRFVGARQLTVDIPLDPARTTAPVSASASAGMKTASTSGVVRAGALMAVATVVSRITGLLSKIALLAILGAGAVSSSYTVANTLPNIVFELLIGGVLTSVAIPLLTRAQRSDPDGGEEYTERLMTIAVVGLLIATALAVAGAPLLARLYSSGAASRPELTTSLGRLLLPQIFFYGVAALFGAILNTKERFAANAWAPVLNNVVVIGVAVVLFAGRIGRVGTPDGLTSDELLILGIGTTLGIAVQAAVMIPPLLRSGFRFHWRWGWDPRLGEAGGLIAWAVVYVLVSQVGVVVATRIAFAHSKAGPVVFGYASVLFQMPYGILGVAVLTAIMPRLSRHAAAGEIEDVKNDVSLANRLSAVALLPVSAALVVIGGALSVALFAWGQVKVGDALQIGRTVGALALGLVPLAMTLVQMRVFYAMKDGRTPTAINAVMVAVRVPLLLLSTRLGPDWVLPGLALATAVSYLVGAVVGEWWLRSRFGPMGTRRTLTTIGKMVLASAGGGAAGYYAARWTVGISPSGVVDALVTTVVATIVGLFTVGVLCAVLRVDELRPVLDRLSRLVGRSPGRSPRHSSSRSMGESIRSDSPSRLPGWPESPAAEDTVELRVGGRGDTPRYLPDIPQTPNREQVTELVTDPNTGVPREIPSAAPVGSPADATAVVNTDATADIPAESTYVIPVGAAAGMHEQETAVMHAGATQQIAVTPPAADARTTPGAADDFAPGVTVGGRYRLVSLVGVDSADNKFWRAKDNVLPRDMAVTLLPDSSATSATVARTLRVGRLHHIGLPQTLDVGTEAGHSYVVGQWVDGATLTDLIAGGPLEPDVATSITAKVAEAVAEAHRNGIALGAINPSLVRVNFDGQVRLSHVIAHGSATPDQDIRAIGGLLYLMLTGTWPLAAPGSTGSGSPGPVTGSLSGNADPTRKLGTSGGQPLPVATTRRGREIPANEARPGVPEALSALAERALHPDEPAGIHAVGAISALLKQPDPPPATVAPSAGSPARPMLAPAERRLIRERRIKLSVAAVMIAAFSALILIVTASLSKQVLGSIQDPNLTTVAKLDSPRPSAAVTSNSRSSGSRAPSVTASGPGRSSPAPSSSAAPTVPPSAPVKITDATVYDPNGDGVKDNTEQVPQAFDGFPATAWATFVYKDQLPALKPGVGLTLEFATEITPTSVQVTSDTPNSMFEVRSATSRDMPFEQTTVIGEGMATSSPVTISLTSAPKSKYLIVFVSHFSPSGLKWKSDINEIAVAGY